MIFYRKYFIFFIFSLFCFESKAILGSITDPGLSSERDVNNAQSLQVSIKTKITRNHIGVVDNLNEFVKADQQYGLFNGLSVNYDLSFSYPLVSVFSFLEQSSFFEKVNAFFVLNYKRPVYAEAKKVQTFCWSSYICFGDINLGMSKPVAQTDRFKSKSSVYLSVPFSKRAFDTSFLAGLGAGFDTSYKLLSGAYFNLSALSNHFVDLNFYLYEKDSPERPNYNVPFTTFHQMGLQVNYSKKSAFIPVLFFYGKYNFSVNFKGVSFHRIGLSGSLSWSVSKKTRIVAILSWGDHALKSDQEPKETVIFHPDRTFVSLAGS